MQGVSKSKFKAQALEYFRLVQSGESFVVTDRGRPVARIIPYRESQESVLAKLRGSVLNYTDPTKPVATDDWELLP